MNTDARNATASSEDGFHEIHLSGKQLVFLFMATTVVSIVIFLCGVLVGRGVRTEASAALTPASETGPAATPTADAATAASQATNVGASELSYYERLGSAEPPPDTVKAGTEVPEPVNPAPPPPSPTSANRDAAVPADATRPPSTPPPTQRAPEAAAPAAAEPGGWAVQVAAVRQKAEADSIAARLKQKGYDAYVVAPAAGTSTPMYRVRVGSYVDRGEAERMMRRLADQERFKPWITR